MWEVIKVFDSIGTMETSWRVGKKLENGCVLWAGEKTKNYELAKAAVKFWNEKERKRKK